MASLWSSDVHRLVIADDHPLIVAGAAALLADQPDLEVLGTSIPVAEADEVVRREQPDVLVIATALRPDSRALAERSAAPSVLYTPMRVAVPVADLVASGIQGVVLQSQPASRLVTSVRRVAAGMTDHSDLALTDSAGAAADALTDREREVLALLADGLTPRQIADQLTLSLHTVRNHLRHVMAKLGTSTQVHTVAVALRAGLVS